MLSILIKITVQINHVIISNQPNRKQYGQKSDEMTLTCKGNGNPEPYYNWFKKQNSNIILSKKSFFYVIEHVIQNNSGMYICEVYNIIEDVL